MTDAELLNELDAAATRMGGITRLSQAAADACIQRLSEKFVNDCARHWWWESLSVPSRQLSYGSGDGLSALADLVGLEHSTVLLVTDDTEPPWAVYEGDAKIIVSALRECRFFEYALAARDASWIIFDTHHNELVVAGRLVGST